LCFILKSFIGNQFVCSHSIRYTIHFYTWEHQKTVKLSDPPCTEHIPYLSIKNINRHIAHGTAHTVFPVSSPIPESQLKCSRVKIVFGWYIPIYIGIYRLLQNTMHTLHIIYPSSVLYVYKYKFGKLFVATDRVLIIQIRTLNGARGRTIYKYITHKNRVILNTW